MSEWSQYTTRHIPWAEGADGPEAYDCGGFVKMIQSKHFGIKIDRVFVANYDDGINILYLINGCAERINWDQVKNPMHGDIVIIRRPIHVGVYIADDGGGVLHCARGLGVLFTRDASWAVSGFGRKTYFRHRSKM